MSQVNIQAIIQDLGGHSKVARLITERFEYISRQAVQQWQHPIPIDRAEQLAAISSGKYSVKDLRPDLAALFSRAS